MAREVVVAPAPAVERAWMLDAGDVVRLVGADLERGLTTTEAERRLAETGPNVLEEAHHRPAWLVFAAQFTSTIVIVLLVAAGVMALLGDLRIRSPSSPSSCSTGSSGSSRSTGRREPWRRSSG